MPASNPRSDRYLLSLLAVGIPAILLGTWLCQILSDSRVTLGFVLGGGISLVNAVIGGLLLKWALGRSPTALLAVVLGGFFGRLAVIVIALFALMHLTPAHPTALGLSVVGFYFLFMTVELFGMRRRLFPVREVTEIASSS